MKIKQASYSAHLISYFSATFLYLSALILATMIGFESSASNGAATSNCNTTQVTDSQNETLANHLQHPRVPILSEPSPRDRDHTHQEIMNKLIDKTEEEEEEEAQAARNSQHTQ
jgi:hypothetical protein